jgi:hypothetical protein
MKQWVHTMAWLGGMLLVVPSVLLAFSVPASAASTTLTTTGARATYNSSNHVLTVCDTKRDGWNAYAWWNHGTSTATPTNRIETSRGNGTCDSHAIPGGSSVITFRACRDVRNNPDNCSGWATVSW